MKEEMNMWSADRYLKKMYDEAISNHSHSYDENWQRDLKEKFNRSLGSFSNTHQPFDPIILEEIDMGEYRRLRIEITTIDSLKMPLYVCIPKIKSNKKLPAVLAIHGHGYGSKEVVGLQPDGSTRKDKGYHKNFAIELVKRGVVVIAPELIGFGDRKLQDDQEKGNPEDNSCYMLASQLLLLGKTLAGLRVQEVIRVIDYTESIQEVNKEKIGIMGISGGGLVAAFTSILDERIKATVISGYTNTFKSSIMARRHCLDNHIPNILAYAEMPELIGLIAPRPLFIESGVEDHLFPIEDTSLAVEKLTDIYNHFNVKDLLSYHFFEGGHEISGEQSYEWLINHLI